MTINFSEPGKVIFTMYDYINNIIDSLPDDMKGSSVSPAGDHLFKMDKGSAAKLNKKEAQQLFHHYTAQLLFLAKRARPDLQTAVAFLCTRVHEPDDDDFKKLVQVMKYLQASPHLLLILSLDQTGNIYWSVDAAFLTVQSDMRGHTREHT